VWAVWGLGLTKDCIEHNSTSGTGWAKTYNSLSPIAHYKIYLAEVYPPPCFETSELRPESFYPLLQNDKKSLVMYAQMLYPDLKNVTTLAGEGPYRKLLSPERRSQWCKRNAI